MEQFKLCVQYLLCIQAYHNAHCLYFIINLLFSVQNGQVQLRQWDDDDECWRVRQRMKRKGKQTPDNTQLIKTKLCWFNSNHPDGCPRNSEQCYFAHGEEDLRIVEKVS